MNATAVTLELAREKGQNPRPHGSYAEIQDEDGDIYRFPHYILSFWNLKDDKKW
jgi:hypothetical protein